MKKNLLTLLATAILGGVAFVGCGDKAPEQAVEEPVLTWQGDACPITGNKYANVPEDMDGELGETELLFTHEGKNYEANVWNEAALSQFEKDKDKYIAIIIAKAE